MDDFLNNAYTLPPESLRKRGKQSLTALPITEPFKPSPLAPRINSLPVTKNGFITFGFLNRLNRINFNTVKLWSDILISLPNAELMLVDDGNMTNHQMVVGWFKRCGIAENRLKFIQNINMQKYQNLHHHIDICLDTLPSRGVTSTCHAAWMGVPTLCFDHQITPSNAANIMAHLGLQSFIVNSVEEYVQQALMLSDNTQQLAQLRLQLRARFRQSLLVQPKKTKNFLERGLSSLLKRWTLGQQKETV